GDPMSARQFPRLKPMRVLAILAILSSPFSSLPSPSQDKKPLPKPLPDKIVQEWKAAGAEVGWLRMDRDGYQEFISAAKGAPGDIPAFRFYSWRVSVLRKLPAPAEPFGLDLGYTTVTDT